MAAFTFGMWEIAAILAVAALLFGGAGVYVALAFFAAKATRPAPSAPAPAQPVQPATDLEGTRAMQAGTLQDLRARIAVVQAQRDNAQRERERLLEGLRGISGEDHKAGVTVAIASARELAERARKLGEHDHAVNTHDAELGELQTELTAAEQLLAEVDTQREALKQQVHEQSHELWKLRAEIEATHRKSHEQRARTMLRTRSNVRKTEVVAGRLEDQLKHWVRKTGEVKVNWSQHGHAAMVAEAFARIDRDFLDRYFSHATNPEYERGQKRSMRINPGTDPDGTRFGEIVIALDDDAGRTLGLRFELKKEAPGAEQVGFVLAMYLRAMTREFRDYDIL